MLTSSYYSVLSNVHDADDKNENFTSKSIILLRSLCGSTLCFVYQYPILVLVSLVSYWCPPLPFVTFVWIRNWATMEICKMLFPNKVPLPRLENVILYFLLILYESVQICGWQTNILLVFVSTRADQKLNKLSFQTHEKNMHYSENVAISQWFTSLVVFLWFSSVFYIHQLGLITICSLGVYLHVKFIYYLKIICDQILTVKQFYWYWYPSKLLSILYLP